MDNKTMLEGILWDLKCLSDLFMHGTIESADNKVVHDIYETQNEEGCIGDTAPYYTGGQPADTTTVSYLLLALSAYKYYGDDALVKKEYEGHKKWVEYLFWVSYNYPVNKTQTHLLV